MLTNTPPAFSPALSGDARVMVGVPKAETFWTMSAIDWKPCFSISLRVIVSSGAGVAVSTVRIREPVTSIRSSSVASSCAIAGTAMAPAITASRLVRMAMLSTLVFLFLEVSLVMDR
jgi:hypothetical protein